MAQYIVSTFCGTCVYYVVTLCFHDIIIYFLATTVNESGFAIMWLSQLIVMVITILIMVLYSKFKLHIGLSFALSNKKLASMGVIIVLF